MNEYLILGLDQRYNVSDAIDSYNTLVEHYKNSNMYSVKERELVLKKLDDAISSITKNKNNFNDTFNRDFENIYSVQTNSKGFGFVETFKRS